MFSAPRDLTRSAQCFWFAFPVLADVPHYIGSLDYDAFNAGAFGSMPNQTYHSTELISPLLLVNKFNASAASAASHIFISPTVAHQHRRPMVLSARDLSLVYVDPGPHGGSNPYLQKYNGTDHLTFWAGQDLNGWGSGFAIIVDGEFRVVRNLTTVGLPTNADNHEFEITDDGGALLINYHTIISNLTAVGGPPDGQLQDSAFQEVDIETGQVRFEWHASDYFDISETMGDPYRDRKFGWDWFHLNSVFKTVQGPYLISSRHLNMIALLNGTDGSRIWQLGGKKNMFEDLSDGRATKFAYQHHARPAVDTLSEITFFDNHALHPTSPNPGCSRQCSRGVRVHLDLRHMTATLVDEYLHPESVQAWAQGGVQSLPGGGALIDWGSAPSFTEYDSHGDVVMDVQTGPWSDSKEGIVNMYRIYKQDWFSIPPWKPKLVIVGQTAYMSWNGATDVAEWVLLGGPDPRKLDEIGSSPRDGFETAIRPSFAMRYYQADALGGDGQVLASSDMVDTGTGTEADPLHLVEPAFKERR